MAEIRLSKLTKQFSIGLARLVDFLNEKGANVEMNPNAKISDEYLPLIEAKFGEDLKLKKDSEKVTIKLKEIIEMGSKKKSAPEEEDIPEREVVIKSNVFNTAVPEAAPVKEEPVTVVEDKPAEPAVETKPEPVSEPEPAPVQEAAKTVAGPKVIDKIDLSQFEKKPAAPAKEEVKKAEEPAPAVEQKPEPAPAPVQTPAEEPEQPVAKPEPREVKIEVERLAGPKVVDKIDLSQFDKKKKKKKRERIGKDGGSQKVDVTKVEASNNAGKKDKNKGGNNSQQQQQAQGKGKKNRRDRGGDKFKPAMTEAEQEEMQKEIQKQIKETYARMNESKKGNFGAKHRKEKRELASQRMQEEMEMQELEQKVLKVTEFVTVNDLATLMNNTPVTKVIGACMSLGMMVSINQRLDAETLVLVAEEFGYEVEFVTANLTEAIEQGEAEDTEEDLMSRPPVITVMGHVDHGKTSLLDNIRKTNVIEGEAGGITQHIGAYSVSLNGQKITFLDTPGHEAFTAMRARGAKITDVAIIIVSADDSVMPQTVEAINHAQAAGVPMVFAINKIDKPQANPDHIKEQLAQMNYLVEEWGGKYQSQDISAKKGINLDKLLEKVLLEAEMLDLKANPNKKAQGSVIESTLDKGRGYVATIMVQSGTLRIGDILLSGTYTGRVKAMFDENGKKVTEAGPSTPVQVLGLNGAPQAGDNFNVMDDDRSAREIANKREQLQRMQGLMTQKHITLDEIGRRIAIGSFKELNIIVKGDVDGSVEAMTGSLIKLSKETVQVNVIHSAVGQISESDVLLATASNAIIVGFQVRPSAAARKTAEKEEIEIRLYSIIYDAVNDIKDAIEGMLEPVMKEVIVCSIEVLETFKISKVGTIAGGIVREGKLQRNTPIRVIRDGIVIHTGKLGSLKRFKDDVKEVTTGQDCGLNIESYNDIKVGDIIEGYDQVEVKRK